MDISRYSELLEKEFVAQLQTKPSWGKNEVVGIFKDAQIKALRELVQSDTGNNNTMSVKPMDPYKVYSEI